ncbi:transcriptional regulator with XRE-family HTH domain [Chryseobacterium defluvii]|uniref:Transcriptional regulator with XRE-family HTH domain n=1 Tax=Chryseobacterium defluvii TaxID=160396 RepID=A0A840KDR6_9FLAO|nr:helix-turn-helix transcriptional regulator [Chryseobacterium defluvii]MBB4807306.1 transcriptional regulator with XRE-family HTH domain [Chryseobacterium defluvii]
MIIGAKLKQARERKKMSQDELALLLNTTQKTISNWESDKSVPSLDHLSKIETVLEVDILSWLAEKGITFNQHNDKGDNAAIINKTFSEELKEQYEMRLQEKDKSIEDLKNEILFLRKVIENK